VTDHLDEAAAKAVELASDPNQSLTLDVAAHLGYLAGLIRGGAVQEPEVTEELIQEVGRALAARNAKLAEVEKAMTEVDGLVPRRQLNRARAQRDELLAAAKEVIACGNLENRACLREAVDRIECER
jgi:hypothetical protein